MYGYELLTRRSDQRRSGSQEPSYARTRMAKKLGLLDQLIFGEWADRDAINRNAEVLSTVEANLDSLRATVQRQSQEILQLRAMFLGLVEVVQGKVAFDDTELESAVKAAYASLTPAPKRQASTDPYRNNPITEPSPEEVAAAKALLVTAQDHHFSRRFAEARAIYQQIVDNYGDTKQAATARQQQDNLRTV